MNIFDKHFKDSTMLAAVRRVSRAVSDKCLQESNMKLFFIETLTFKLLCIDLLCDAKNERVLKRPFIFAVYLLATLAMAIFMSSYAIKYFHDVEQVVQSSTIFIQCCLCIVKITYFLLNSKRFLKLINIFRSFEHGKCKFKLN